MFRKLFLVACVFWLAGFSSVAGAKDFVIKDYGFTWEVAKTGDVGMQIQKKPGSISVILSSLGGKIATLSMTPSEAKAIGEVLEKTEEYYNKQKKSDDRKSEDVVHEGQFRVYFSSSQGKNFQVSIRSSKFFSAAVLLNRDEALEMGKHLRDAEDMAAFVNRRIKP